MMFSRKVFWGATSPRLAPVITTEFRWHHKKTTLATTANSWTDDEARRRLRSYLSMLDRQKRRKKRKRRKQGHTCGTSNRGTRLRKTVNKSLVALSTLVKGHNDIDWWWSATRLRRTQ
ncbi:unnamed protein product [Soboliphyme baturini]|uniref:Secreted protein n=1 Tax=Soboliphyme baturini TaxID=241478 RepID=A0A183I918_9BILA|nr:unnamed protein product [Soboliphyme baturini]